MFYTFCGACKQQESTVKKSCHRIVIGLALAGLMLSANMAIAQNSCAFTNGPIKHVVYIVFDNVHLTRDNPNVPSDLELQPNLLNFIEGNGTMDANHHPVLISHTADDILSTLTGVYGDRHGQPVSNNYQVYTPDGTQTANGVSSFFYWTDKVSDTSSFSKDNTFGMLNELGMNAPAPWVPFTRAGCDVGAYSTANIVLERSSFDEVVVFGSGSPEATEKPSALQTTDYIGVAVHCAKGSAICAAADASAPAGKSSLDSLPQEPGGYNNFRAVFGAKYVNAAFGSPIKDIDGNVITGSNGSGGQVPGFPGFSPTASQTLGAVATMLEKGTPVVFAYISDIHDNQAGGNSFGPGEAGYVAQGQAYNVSWGKFFSRLAAEGINQTNTLFIFTADEGDHFVGGVPDDPTCDGTPGHFCTYVQNGKGELTVNLNALVLQDTGNTTPFTQHFDDAPTIHILPQQPVGSSIARTLERQFADLTLTNPYTKAVDNLLFGSPLNDGIETNGTNEATQGAIVDQVGESILHMVTADPQRTPTFTLFGDPDYFLQASGPTTNPLPNPGFMWNHGDIQPEIGRDWLGIVGPGVAVNGLNTDAVSFSDHTDLRPTMLKLLGLHDDYQSDGRVLVEILNSNALPASLTKHQETLIRLGESYKDINAPFAQLGMDTLKISTTAVTSGDSGNDSVYTSLEGKLSSWKQTRDAIAGNMKQMLEDTAFNNISLDNSQAEALIVQASALLREVHKCAIDPLGCASGH